MAALVRIVAHLRALAWNRTIGRSGVVPFLCGDLSRIEQQQFGRSLVRIIEIASSGDTMKFGGGQSLCGCHAVIKFGGLVCSHVAEGDHRGRWSFYLPANREQRWRLPQGMS